MLKISDTNLLNTLGNLLMWLTGDSDAGQVAFDIG